MSEVLDDFDRADPLLHETLEHDGAASRTIGTGFWIGVGWIAAIVLAAILAPFLLLDDPDALNPDSIRPGADSPASPPSLDHWFGTDALTRDVFSRTIWGARTSLTVGFAAIAIGMLVGGTLGLLAGYFKGPTDKVVSFLFLALLSFPALVLAILITALIDRSLFTVSVTLGILAIAPVGRVSRATTLADADREFVVAARTLGASNGRIIVRELLPNVLVPMTAFGLLGVAVAIVAEGALAFLGLSVEGGISWGTIIRDGSGPSDLRDSPWVALAPIAVLFTTVLALNYAGDRVRTYYDVRDDALR
jgi:peptide/nickel transport system permease protein